MYRWCRPFEEDTPAELLRHTLRPGNILMFRAEDYKKEDIAGRESVDEVAEVLHLK